MDINASLNQQVNEMLAARPKKMQSVRDAIAAKVEPTGVPYLKVRTDDNIMSSVWITGSYDAEGTWSHGIWENSRNFRFHVTPAGRRQYYDAAVDANVTVELTQHGLKRGEYKKFRRYSGPVDKVAAKIAEWIEANKATAGVLDDWNKK